MPFCAHCGKELSGDERFCPHCGAPTPSPTPIAPPSTTAAPPTRVSQPPSTELGRGVVLAGWGDRFLAWLIDWIILGAISELVRLPGFSLPAIPFVAFGFRDFVLFLYWTLMEGTSGQSIGKMAMRLKVTRTDGSPASLADAAVESFGKAFLLPIDCIIGWVAESCKEKKQRLSNMLSKTVVIKVPR